LKEDRPAEAAEPAKRLVDLLPDTAAVLTLFAETQAKTDQKAAAIAAYRKALKSDPDYGPALTGLSQTLLLRKRYDEVVEMCIRASERAPADPLPLQLLSDALAGKGAFEDAREAAEAALKLNPRAVADLVRLSVLSRKLEDHGPALRFALAGHDLDTKAKEPLNALGAALAALKYSSQARSVLTGMNSGQGLDPAVRKLVEGLVTSLTATPRPKKTPSAGEDEVPSDADPVQKQMENETPSEEGVAKNTIEGSESLSSGPREYLSADGDQLPNVLGLRRQDLS
jgi:tetratricopeptide (TPR) repeat protein